MKQRTTFLISAILFFCCMGARSDEQDHLHNEGAEVVSHGEQHYHDDHGQQHDESDETITITSSQMSLASIRVAKLTPRIMGYEVYAPGEIRANGYTSYQVSPRVDSVVLRRHVALGDHVEVGQELVTLFSESVADAQASYRIANSEWQRVQKLGRESVGEKRYVSAQTDYEAGYGRLLAFGLSEKAIGALSENSQSLGEYTLFAAISGAVLSDSFHQGQRLISGQALMELADERELWVEAHLPPTTNLELPPGSLANIKVGESMYPAVVTQEAHTIDSDTRTRVIRMVVNNDSHRLHPGQFADVYFSFTTEKPVTAVPESALMRSADGDWTVFVEEEPGEFRSVVVALGRSFGNWREISGVSEGAPVVMEGAFFVASQLAKGGFDPHNH